MGSPATWTEVAERGPWVQSPFESDPALLVPVLFLTFTFVILTVLIVAGMILVLEKVDGVAGLGLFIGISVPLVTFARTQEKTQNSQKNRKLFHRAHWIRDRNGKGNTSFSPFLK